MASIKWTKSAKYWGSLILLFSFFLNCSISNNFGSEKVSYLGPQGSFTYLAATKKFPGKTLVPQNSIEACFASVNSGQTKIAVVPLKNSIGGTVVETDLAIKKFPEIKTESSLVLPISQNLMANAGTVEIERIFSHPQALKQCKKFLDSLYPGVQQIEYSSTSAAAKWVSENPKEKWAAIANPETAKMYKLTIMHANIQDDKDNRTTFIVISKK